MLSLMLAPFVKSGIPQFDSTKLTSPRLSELRLRPCGDLAGLRHVARLRWLGYFRYLGTTAALVRAPGTGPQLITLCQCRPRHTA